MEFKSYADLETDVVRLLPRLPRDLDLIVAIPRSGLIPATMIALHMNLPLTDLEGLYEGRLISSGHRKLKTLAPNFGDTPLNVLIVDDSVGTGAQLREIRAQLAQRGLPHRFQVAVIYATAVGAPLVDYFVESVPTLRHFFAWNVMHHGAIGKWCVDIDGVLCRNCTPEEDDDAEHYLRFLQTAEPLFVPTGTVVWLVTGRLEKHRALTEAWLQRHGIVYENLLMCPLTSNKERQASGGGGRFKGDIYKEIDAGLFIESKPYESQDIANISGKPVLCIQTRSMFRPSPIVRLRRIANKGPGAYIRYARRRFDNLRQYMRNARFAKKPPAAQDIVPDAKHSRDG